jgi:hypothetical protein
MAGEYWVQLHAKRGATPMRQHAFDHFAALFEFVKEFKTHQSDDALHVHLPSSSPAAEIKQISDIGGVSTFDSSHFIKRV